MIKFRANGFLLMEAIVALSLLAAGVGVVSVVFAQVRDASRRDRSDFILALEARQKWLEELTGLKNERPRFAWVRLESAFSPALTRVTWVASWEEEGNHREKSFEMVR